MSELQGMVNEVESYYFDNLNTHVHEWAGERMYLGISSLVKKTASAYAKKIIERVDEDRRREDGIWSLIGNGLADAVLKPYTPHRECRVKIDCGDYDLYGHCDAIKFHDGYAEVCEAKAFATVQDGDATDLALRQCGLYAFAFQEQARRGCGVFPLASFQHDPTAQAITKWPENTPIKYLSLFIIPRMGPQSITDTCRPYKPHPVGDGDLQLLWDFYSRKADAIHRAVVAGDVGIAKEWDNSPEGLLEFHRAFHDIPRIPEDDEVAEFATKKNALSKQRLSSKKEEDSAAQELKAKLASMAPWPEGLGKAEAKIGNLLVSARLPDYTHLSVKETKP